MLQVDQRSQGCQITVAEVEVQAEVAQEGQEPQALQCVVAEDAAAPTIDAHLRSTVNSMSTSDTQLCKDSRGLIVGRRQQEHAPVEAK